MQDIHRRGKFCGHVEGECGRQREGRHRRDSAADGAIGMTLVGMTARCVVVVARMRRRGNWRSRHHRGMLFRRVMMGVRIGGNGRRRNGRALGGRFKNVKAKLILRGGVGDQRDRNKPRGKTQTPESRKPHGAKLRARAHGGKRTNFESRGE